MTDQPKWTPGPWRVEVRPEVAFVVGPDNVSIVMRAFGNFGISENTKATMGLIAAAPDLYEALDALVVELCDYMKINHLGDPEQKHNIKLARAAFAKARGQS